MVSLSLSIAVPRFYKAALQFISLGEVLQDQRTSTLLSSPLLQLWDYNPELFSRLHTLHFSLFEMDWRTKNWATRWTSPLLILRTVKSVTDRKISNKIWILLSTSLVLEAELQAVLHILPFSRVVPSTDLGLNFRWVFVIWGFDSISSLKFLFPNPWAVALS